MNQKYNPFLSLVALLVLAVLLLFLVGCSGNAEAADAEHRFTLDYDCSDIKNQVIIITDTETGHQYLFVDGYRACTMVRLDPPVVEDRKEQ